MSPTFAEKARQAQKNKRGGQEEKDPADLTGAQEPNWDDPNSWGGGGPAEDDSASGSAGDSAGGNREPEPEPEPPSSPVSKGAPRTPRRRGRPRGPQRVPVTVRLLESTDRKLTVAVEQTGLNPQTILEEALEAHFRRLKIQDPGPESSDSGEGAA
ncbi:hypothetical protein AB0O42_34995 [Streptomyces sp. NPDC089922]|uniref:hypothetical protein n=1 Tax=Streptomyces sp. NPDC089922 TaxID=3155189 RepID=UPI003440659A